jgi:hypothetical protein
MNDKFHTKASSDATQPPYLSKPTVAVQLRMALDVFRCLRQFFTLDAHTEHNRTHSKDMSEPQQSSAPSRSRNLVDLQTVPESPSWITPAVIPTTAVLEIAKSDGA